MFEAKYKCKTLEVVYSSECFRFRFYSPQKATDHPMQRQYVSRLPSNILNALLDRMWQILLSDYSHEELVNVGQLLYRQIIPEDLSSELKGESEGILIVSEDHSIPWELLHDGENFLGIRHIMGRCLVWNLSEKPPEDKKQKNCLIISNPTGDLEEAENETVSLMNFLRSHQLSCKYLARSEATLDGILMELNSCNYDFIHYSGHVVKTETGEYAFALARQQYLTVNVIKKLSFGKPVVFINGCSSGKVDITQHPDPLQAEIEGVAVPFISAGAIAVIGTLLRVPDYGARRFAEIFYTSVLEGESIGDAMSKARNELLMQNGTRDSAWASFILYGNPVLYYLRNINGAKRLYDTGNKPSLSSPNRQKEKTEPIKDMHTDINSNVYIVEELKKKNKRLIIANFILVLSLLVSITLLIINLNTKDNPKQVGEVNYTPISTVTPVTSDTESEFKFDNLTIESVQAYFNKNKNHYFVEIQFNRILSDEEKGNLKFNRDIYFYRIIDNLTYEDFFPYWNAIPTWIEENGKSKRVIESELLPPKDKKQKLVYVAKMDGQKEVLSPELYVSSNRNSVNSKSSQMPVENPVTPENSSQQATVTPDVLPMSTVNNENKTTPIP